MRTFAIYRQTIRLRWHTTVLLRTYAVREWWMTESERRLMDGNR